MVDVIQVDSSFADPVEQELLTIKPIWRYYNYTTDFPDKTRNEEIKRDISILKQKFPVKDTQRFTDTIYSAQQQHFKTASSPKYTPFVKMRQNKDSRYNKDFPNTARLINYLQDKYIPRTHLVKRFLINMQTIRPTYSLNEIHPDYIVGDYITILYYVNDSDGDTYFFEGTECVKRVSPIKGTAAIYPSTMLHAGSTPTKTETRIVINICFGPKDS